MEKQILSKLYDFYKWFLREEEGAVEIMRVIKADSRHVFYKCYL